MPPKQFPLALWLSILPLARGSDSSAYVAAAACAQCHRAIATTQAKMNMAQPWQGVATRILAPAYRASHAEGPAPSIAYRAVRNGKSDLQFETALPGRPAIMSPVEAVIGGERHGVSFLMRIQAIEGAALSRDPLPVDLLISNKVNALKNSERYIQSGAAIRCTNCHDPHQDAPGVAAKSVQTCLQCHSERVERHAALCPVNRERGCLGCHMPGATKGSFTMVDHWIRVHPEQPLPDGRGSVGRSEVRPRREYLRIIATNDASKAALALERPRRGESFFDVASRLSVDPSAAGGGYLGDMWLDKMDSKL